MIEGNDVMSKVFAVMNQQGGIGKTVTSVNLSVAFAQKGYKVLLIDGDAQGNTTRCFGISNKGVDNTLYDMLSETSSIKKCVRQNVVAGLSIIPSSIELAGLEIELEEKTDREFILKKKLQNVKEEYDYIIIDCPPVLNLVAVNALAVAAGVIVPMQCDSFALERFERVNQTIEIVKEELNPDIKIEGMLFTMYDSENSEETEIIKEARGRLKEKIFANIIPRDVNLAKADAAGLAIYSYESNSPGAECYKELADEISKK